MREIRKIFRHPMHVHERDKKGNVVEGRKIAYYYDIESTIYKDENGAISVTQTEDVEHHFVYFYPDQLKAFYEWLTKHKKELKL
jgi:hypothetical protein